MHFAMSDLTDNSSGPSEGEDYGDDGRDDDLELLSMDQDHDDVSRSESSEEEHEDDGDGDDQHTDNVPVQRGKDLDVSKFVLCGKHKAGSMVPDTCSSCRAGLKIIKDKDAVKKLTNGNQSGSGILSRYQGRCDTISPTLVLSPETIQLALEIFTKGVFKDKRFWIEIVRNYLTLPHEQHEMLNADIKFEDSLTQFKKVSRFQNLFRYGADLARNIKNLRISQ